MTRVTFGVSASSFAANMAVKQNASDLSQDYPMAAEMSFYVDFKSALLLQRELTEMFARGGFVLRKWNSNDRSILKQIPEALRDPREVQACR